MKFSQRAGELRAYLQRMAILKTKKVWKRERQPSSRVELNRFTPKEETGVRTAADVLRIRFGNWSQAAKALRMDVSTIRRAVGPRGRVPASFAMRVARLLGVPLGEILTGAFPRADECPLCGHRTHRKAVVPGTKENAREAVGRLRALRFGVGLKR